MQTVSVAGIGVCVAVAVAVALFLSGHVPGPAEDNRAPSGGAGDPPNVAASTAPAAADNAEEPVGIELVFRSRLKAGEAKEGTFEVTSQGAVTAVWTVTMRGHADFPETVVENRFPIILVKKDGQEVMVVKGYVAEGRDADVVFGHLMNAHKKQIWYKLASYGEAVEQGVGDQRGQTKGDRLLLQALQIDNDGHWSMLRAMPRIARGPSCGILSHVVNRGNARMTVFPG